MIVTCPACTSRYKFDDARLDGRSAKITCPTCDHIFVVDPPRVDSVTLKDTWPSAAGAEAEPGVMLSEHLEETMNIRDYDFAGNGVLLRVRQGLVTREFHTLHELLESIDEGTVDTADELSTNGATWEPIGSEEALIVRLEAVKAKLDAGEVVPQAAAQSFIIGDEDGDEDAPTMIVRTANLNLDEVLADDDDPPPPPPAAPAFSTEEEPAPTEGDPPTETATVDPPAPQAISSTTQGNPVASALKANESRSVLPIVLLVLVVIAVIVLIGYTQGLIPGLGA